MELLEKYPCFRAMYEDIYELCCNTERVMGMFSKELQKLDENTMQYMIDEMQDTIDKKTVEIAVQKEQLTIKDEQLADKDKLLAEQASIINALKQQLKEQEQK